MSASIGPAPAPPPPPGGAGRRRVAAEPLQDHFGRVAVRAALVLPFTRLQLAFEVNFRALLAILLGDFAQVLIEDHDIVPFGALLALARTLVAPGFGGGDREAHHLIAGIEPSNIRVLAQIADQNDFVDATRHD